VSIRDCILGDDAEVASHTKFLRCIVGQKCNTLNNSYFIGCTFYPESTLSNFMISNTVLGQRNFLTSGAMFWSDVTRHSVTVNHQGQEVDTGRLDIGGCAGHRCILGARAIVQAGRMVPNRMVIVMRPGEGVLKLPGHVEPTDAYVCHRGGIAKLGEAFPDFRAGEID
jgi:hypothetical protein